MRLRADLVLLLLLAHPLRASAAPDLQATITLDGGEDDADLRRALARELPPAAISTATTADLRLEVRRAPPALIAVLADQRGHSAERRFSLAGGVAPALRRVVLLAARAHAAVSEALAQPEHSGAEPRWLAVAAESMATPEVPPAEAGGAPPDPPAREAAEPAPEVRVEAPPLPAAAPWLWVQAGYAFVWWSTPASPQPGPTLAARVPLFEGLEVGGRLVMQGLPSIRRSARGISAEVREYSLLAEGSLRLLAAGAFELRADLAVGTGFMTLSVNGDAYISAGVVQSYTKVEPVLVRAGVSLRAQIWRDLAGLWLDLGVESRLVRPKISLDAFYAAESLDPGILGPYAQAGLALSFR